MKKTSYFLITAVLSTIISYAQDKNPDAILHKVKTEFLKINDYSVDAVINVDVDFLKVPESKATIFFKQPDKMKLESEGFALLPKQGLDFSPSKLLEEDYTAIYTKTDTIDGENADIIKVIPENDSSGIILSTLWIDEDEYIIRKVESTSKRTGTFAIHLFYDNKSLKLPSKVSFMFNVTEVPLPASLTGDFDHEDEKPKRNREKQMSGTVVVTYSNYKINIGLTDKFFEEDKNTTKN